jgi:hypothetical protein
MPECRRCERVQATAEVRRTTLGWLCKDNAAGSRCWTIARELAAARRRERRDRAHATRGAEASACLAIAAAVLLLLVCVAPARAYPGFWLTDAHCIHYYEAAHHGPPTRASFRRDWRVGWHLTRTAAGQPSTNRGGLQIGLATWVAFAPKRWPKDPARASRAQQLLVAWRIWRANGNRWGGRQWPGSAAACGVR